MVADGTYASAMPDKPLRPNLLYPGTVSVPEGARMGIPAGSIAVPEALPLIGVAKSGYNSTMLEHRRLGRTKVCRPSVVCAADRMNRELHDRQQRDTSSE